jgi:hypothetical protein
MRISSGILKQWSAELEHAMSEDAPGWRVQEIADRIGQAAAEGAVQEAEDYQREYQNSR